MAQLLAVTDWESEMLFAAVRLKCMTANVCAFMMMPARIHLSSRAATSASKESVTGIAGDEVSGPREDDGTGLELIVTAEPGGRAAVTFTSEEESASDVTEKHCSQRNPVGDVWMKASRMPHSVQKDGM